MNLSIRLIVPLVALVAFSAEAADVTGDWKATIVTAAGQRDYTFVFRQNEGRLIGTIKSPDGVVAMSSELVSDSEIRFKRDAGPASPVVEFVATRVGKP